MNLEGLIFHPNIEEEQVVAKVFEKLAEFGLSAESDFNRPWGVYFTLSYRSGSGFVRYFFMDEISEEWATIAPPRILVLKPEVSTPWQFHTKTDLKLKVINGPVGLVRSDNGREPDYMEVLPSGGRQEISHDTRYRLQGLKNWSVVGGFWTPVDQLAPNGGCDTIRILDNSLRR